jgi:ligand-binding sensor domain-containing protein/signal transduction histidine kinase
VLATGLFLHAQQLPLRRYTTADGLPSNAVYGIAGDSRGFLWFATAEGLSRFDGFSFTTHTAIAGLPRTAITQILIGRHDNYWLATADGLIRFRPDLPPSSRDRMTVLRPGGSAAAANIYRLMEDRSGALWCGTEAGLFEIEDTAAAAPRLTEVKIGLPGVSWGDSSVSGLAEDAEGGMWIGTRDGTLYHRLPDRRMERFPGKEELPQGQITWLHADRKGILWVGRGNWLERSLPAPHPGANGFERLSGRPSGPPLGRVFQIFESREGDVWVGIYRCLVQFPANGGPGRVWNGDNGLSSRGVGTMGQDRDGNIWMGTGDEGALKLATGGVLTYSDRNGIGMDAVISIAETRRGSLYLAGRKESEGFHIAVRTGNDFQAIAPRVPRNVKYFGWRPARVVLQDRSGDWWLASSQGLLHYPRLESPMQLAGTLPQAVYTTRDGLPSDLVVRLYEDRGGNIWLGSQTSQLGYWDSKRRRFVRIPADGTPGFGSAFAEDRAGNVWIGDEEGQVWRVRDGRAVRMASRATDVSINAMLPDHAGRLWVATDGDGLLCFDDPEAAAPKLRQYGYADGLSSLSLYSLAEDSSGSIYIGTGGGVDRLHPGQAYIGHYTTADGIAPGQVISAFRDSAGVIWFGTNHGLTRFVPRNGGASEPAPVWITGVSVAGRRVPISEAGESAVRRIEVQPGQENIEFDFVGLSYAPGNILRYQYRLGNEGWSAPMEPRSVHYAALAAGQYRFAVRAVNSDGEASPVPATVELRIIPPLWRQVWFQAILLAGSIGGIGLILRVRAARLIEIERVRSDIALDLHDDIASNLSQITIFSEIALRQTGPDSAAGETLARIAKTARETVECISDIVWSIRPQNEGDLSQRIRRLGSDALTSRQIDVSFVFSEEVRSLILDPKTLRQVYLIYKEALHNTVRHADAHAVVISLKLDGPHLVLKVADDGVGLASPDEGNGLPGMRARAASLGGTLAIRARPGKGTEVELQAPWKKRSETTWIGRVRRRCN